MVVSGCTDDESGWPAGPDHDGVYGFAGNCYAIGGGQPGETAIKFVGATDGTERFGFTASSKAEASRFVMKATDLGTYLLYDNEEHYFGADEDGVFRASEVQSDMFTLDDDYLPGVQWELEESDVDSTRWRMRHLESGRYLTTTGLVEDATDAAVVAFYPAEDCADYPELTLDAVGEIEPPQFDDGSVYGFVETHTHLFSNYGFGGAGIFHGAPFHPLGVEHALPSCEMFHGEGGRADLFGYGFDEGDELDEIDFIAAIESGETPEFNHHTDGYPEFTDWPSAHDSSTHQTQYYRWLQRAWMGGMRLMVQHATSNQIICELIKGTTSQPTRYSCNEMVAVDRILEETRRLERYIDAQHGGPGKGWFRIVESPDEARDVIEEGNLAVVLGIEVSNLFDCFLVPGDEHQRCDQQDVVEALDDYYERGVRAMFPVHKFDNGFSAGDGHRDIIEIGNFAQTGHWSNFTDDCPDVPTVFDRGDVAFGDLNEPREDFFADPPVDTSSFAADPFGLLFDHAERLIGGALQGDYCQNHGMTELGEFLLEEMMRRGMIIELDHLPRRGYQRAFEILEQHDYPGVGSHGNHNDGRLYELGGVSKFNFDSCSDPDEDGTRAGDLEERVELIEEAGGFAAEGFGFDLNGFAGAPGPRFGDASVCDEPQDNPVEYPFESYAGDVTFTQPRLGERDVDFNDEGLVHVGMIPELIEDVRNDGVADKQLEPLFKSAEGYLRMWERTERRAATF